MTTILGVSVLVCGILLYQWRDQGYHKWMIIQETMRDNEKSEMSQRRIEDANSKFQTDFEEYKKRVDQLTLKAGFKF